MLVKESDNELINQVLKGNRSAYAELVKRHQRNVFNLAMRIVKLREEAEEVSQDAFVKAFKSLEQFKQTSKFSTWLYRIVYNTALTQLRKRNSTTVSYDNSDHSMEVEDKLSDYRSDGYEAKSNSKIIGTAISQLSEDDATVISLFYHCEQSLEEIAAVMNIEINNVKIKLHRARQRLKQKLETMLKHEVKDLV